MKNISINLSICVLASFSLMNVSLASEFLADRHVSKNIQCDSCHASAGEPRLKMVDNGQHEACVGCHGFYDKIVEKTAKPDEQNPHAQHDGNLPCTECHKGHKKGVNYCGQCHNFEFKVP